MMPIFKNSLTGKKFFFIHIPRTAGRFFEFNLENSGWEFCSKCGYNTKYEIVDGVELAHFYKKYYEKYLDVKNIPNITIIRNPIDRFISSSFVINKIYGEQSQKLVENNFSFNMIINRMMNTRHSILYVPQVDFLSDRTHIWKYEDGFGKDFCDWISVILDSKVEMKISKNEIDQYKLEYEDDKLKITEDLIYNIKQVYKKDIEKLYPELATPFQERTETKT